MIFEPSPSGADRRGLKPWSWLKRLHHYKPTSSTGHAFLMFGYQTFVAGLLLGIGFLARLAIRGPAFGALIAGLLASLMINASVAILYAWSMKATFLSVSYVKRITLTFFVLFALYSLLLIWYALALGFLSSVSVGFIVFTEVLMTGIALAIYIVGIRSIRQNSDANTGPKPTSGSFPNWPNPPI